MYCTKCGYGVPNGSKFCPRCGNNLNQTQTFNNENYSSYQSNNYQPFNNEDKTIKVVLIAVFSGLGIFILIILFVVFLSSPTNDYYFSDSSYDNYDTNNNSNNTDDYDDLVERVNNAYQAPDGQYATKISADNYYWDVKMTTANDAYRLISKDSTVQKSKCPSEIKSIEDDIINKYGITAVNLCEMDVEFAKELEDVLQKIYTEYPKARGTITNLSLVNLKLSEGSTIAYFMPMFQFAKSDSSSTYPWAIKTQILLSSKYFLNKELLQTTVINSSASGHFPSNSTIYAPVAHEFGHYLSFLAMMNEYNQKSVLLINENNSYNYYKMLSDFNNGTFSLKLINEAYEKYKKDTQSTLTLDQFRGSISQYALAKDNEGNYIYDETIAEAFHDVYVNGGGAKDASKYIINALKQKLGS